LANFKAALEAFAVGKLNHKSLSKQLDGVLNSSPKFANKMLSELNEVYGQKKLNNKQYSVLKNQIIKFRQAHTSKTNKQPTTQKQNTAEKTIAPDLLHEDDGALDATVIGGEEKTVIGGEEKTVIGGEEKTVIGGE